MHFSNTLDLLVSLQGLFYPCLNLVFVYTGIEVTMHFWNSTCSSIRLLMIKIRKVLAAYWYSPGLLLAFLIEVTGWMPTLTGASVFHKTSQKNWKPGGELNC